MDAFEIHRRLIDDYRQFTEGFVDIRDERVAAVVAEQSAKGSQWPAPWVALNPSFASGGRVDELVSAGLLHPECERIFRIKSDAADSGGESITLHRHQRDAVEIAGSGASYVLTTGTGSGKSLAYIVPIVDRVLRTGTGRGVQAIVVYPMNALANSQVEELKKFLEHGYGGTPPVTFKRYTGQESREERDAILADPPDILLTNYVMLELVLTRPDERSSLVRAARGLQFLVLDELHTYRGRQGADVAMLVRRVRDAAAADATLQCVGTSATMSSGGTVAEQQRDVAAVASTIFGTTIRPEHVVTETLVRATTETSPSPAALASAVDRRGDVEYDDPALRSGYGALQSDPLAGWIEDEFGLTTEPGSGRLVRRAPSTIAAAAEHLAEVTGRDERSADTAIRATLLAGSRTRHPETDRPLFAFRLHQFLSKGGSVFATVEPEATRAVETEFQVVLDPSPEHPDRERRLYPLAFCRECGQDYLMARREVGDRTVAFTARHQLRPTDRDDGYLYVSADHPWPTEPVAEGRLPASWLEVTPQGSAVTKTRSKDVPQRMLVAADGAAVASRGPDHELPGHTLAAWIPSSLRFCLRCGVSYEALRSSEFTKLVTLDREGRSSAMTVIASSLVRALRAAPAAELPTSARKLLTFVDNRQDAALQAGHLNDYVLVVQVRTALYQALVAAGDDGLDPSDLGKAVTDQLALEFHEYAQVPDALDQRPVRRALQSMVEYRTLRDLQRGWRVTLPNLEQSGLMVVEYPLARVLAERTELWDDAHPMFRLIDPGQRQEIIEVLLDEFRRVLAIDAEALTIDFVNGLRRRSREHLDGLWALSSTEPDPIIGLVVPESGAKGSPRSVLNLTGRGNFGKWLRQLYKDSVALSTTDASDMIASLVELLSAKGLITRTTDGRASGYRLKASTMLLRAGSGEFGARDPLRRRYEADTRPRVVPLFRDLYREVGQELAGLQALEHTAQVRSDEREEREKRFRSGDLPLLFCSPTMELGVDISSLNAVAMRNVPPTPANYAQRSGRAGRSGQPAVVVTYCASGNSHDSYYFERSHLMVSGQVIPPRLDIANEDLVRSHVHAVWLAEALAATDQGLGSSISGVLDLTEDGYPVQPQLMDVLRDPLASARATTRAAALLGPLEPELSEAAWWDASWAGAVIDEAPVEFDRAFNRWRTLYETATKERDAAYAQSSDSTRTRKEREESDRRSGEARQRIELLLNQSDGHGQTDFYTYRYLASEGFLPGYSFPRLPLAAFIPGQRGGDGSWLQRARFLAISEFGPGALIYHDGARYQVTRVSLPRGNGDGGTEVLRSSARVCDACGYHHPVQAGIDVCESCAEPLTGEWKELLQLQSVITRRRERISADEEERNRVGFELRTTYRFLPRGSSNGRFDATVASASGRTLLDVQYGDAAEVRVTNLGRRNRKHKDVHGFYLDLVKGRWLSEKDYRSDDTADPDDEMEAGFDDVTRKAQVTPYVEDRRNIAVLRWTRPVSESEAVTLQYALERGIETTFELEDSELASELLPDPDERGRLLLIEAAEGGAGVLRRLQSEPNAVARAARRALEIMHVDPDTGSDVEGACVRGCYRCLLSYGNQLDHESIDRRAIVPLLLDLATATTFSEATGVTTASTTAATAMPSGPRAAALWTLLQDNNFRTPDRVDVEHDGVRIDMAFPTPGIPTAVLVYEPGGDVRDAVTLQFGGWNVVEIPADADLLTAVRAHPTVFGEATS